MRDYLITFQVQVRLGGVSPEAALAGAESRASSALDRAGFARCAISATSVVPVDQEPPAAPAQQLGESGMPWVDNDGGRSAAGYKGTAGDCVARSIAIAAQLPYAEVYEALAKGNASQRVSKHDRSKRKINRHARSARSGIFTRRKWFREYMAGLGFTFVPTMSIGSGCTVHLVPGELPAGRLIVSLSRHYTAVIDGVVHDTFDCQRRMYETGCREGVDYRRTIDRCVYGYWVRQ